MGRFANNPDYMLAWPPAIFRAELEALIDRAARIGEREWLGEVETLLRQAFVTDSPLQDFNAEVARGSSAWDFNEPF